MGWWELKFLYHPFIGIPYQNIHFPEKFDVIAKGVKIYIKHILFTKFIKTYIFKPERSKIVHTMKSSVLKLSIILKYCKPIQPRGDIKLHSPHILIKYLYLCIKVQIWHIRYQVFTSISFMVDLIKSANVLISERFYKQIIIYTSM